MARSPVAKVMAKERRPAVQKTLEAENAKLKKLLAEAHWITRP